MAKKGTKKTKTKKTGSITNQERKTEQNYSIKKLDEVKQKHAELHEGKKLIRIPIHRGFKEKWV